jgi:3-phosphoshikimate 1-carboxyvinyltransferase
MALPDLIEIIPLPAPVTAEITVPGSKSITNRALLLAALGEGETILRGALWSEDTQVMVECLQELGFMVNAEPDPFESGNRTLTVYGRAGLIPPGGTKEQPLDLFVGNAGTAARFLAAAVCLGQGVYRLHGVPRMHERPQGALFKALRELGYQVESVNDRLPVVIHGAGPRPGRCQVSIGQSSQFASALLLCAQVGGWQVEVIGEDAEESPYVVMTARLIKEFPQRGGVFQIEPDASSGSYFWAAGWLAAQAITPDARKGRISVAHWPRSGWQVDARFPDLLSRLETHSSSNAQYTRSSDLGDSIMTAIILAPFSDRAVKFTDLGRLRVQECERVMALRTELTRCGARVEEVGDTLVVHPSNLHGAEIETYQDHRMAMCFAILGLKIGGIMIKNPVCAKKTFPNFFQKLASPPPHGLGAAILDPRTGRKLSGEDLFAD